jgi:hypothetical protein
MQRSAYSAVSSVPCRHASTWASPRESMRQPGAVPQHQRQQQQHQQQQQRPVHLEAHQQQWLMQWQRERERRQRQQWQEAQQQRQQQQHQWQQKQQQQLSRSGPQLQAQPSPAGRSIPPVASSVTTPPMDKETGRVFEVTAFLAECELSQYSSVLLSSGFDTTDALLEMEESDSKDLGILRGHWLKLKRHLRQSQSQHAVGQGSLERQLGSSMSLPPNAPMFYGTEEIRSNVQRSWERIQEAGILYAGELLYKRVFELNPAAKDMLPPEILAKYRQSSLSEDELDSDFVKNATLSNMFSKIFNMVGCSVAGLHDLNKLVPMLHSLGARHIGYGSPEECWEIVGQAVNMTLHEILGDTLTADVEHVWTLGFAFVSSIMIQGLREAKASCGTESSSHTHDRGEPPSS